MNKREVKMLEQIIKTYTKVNEELDTSYNGTDREKSLFLCLDLPDDKVKLAVMQCLFSVELKYYSETEIKQLVSFIKAYKRNIGLGDTETVLSYIFWIFCKFQDDSTKKDKPELTKAYKEAWSYGLEILDTN